jgi:hypothetical protein
MPVFFVPVAPVTPSAHVHVTHVAVLRRAAVGVLSCEDNRTEAQKNERDGSQYFLNQFSTPPL